MDRYNHLASPHNKVCQNMTFRWLCDDLNINLSPGILKITAFWLDLVAYQGFLKDSLTIFENPSNRLLQPRFPPEINIWTNPESWECKNIYSIRSEGLYVLSKLLVGFSTTYSSKCRKIPQKGLQNKVFSSSRHIQADSSSQGRIRRILSPTTARGHVLATSNAGVWSHHHLRCNFAKRTEAHTQNSRLSHYNLSENEPPNPDGLG